MKPLAVLLVTLALGGCVGKLTPREGTITPVSAPQADEQCAAQPWLDWCPR